ncbi:ATP-binding protein [Gilvimarinus sp. F26214L]|uniref:ATP-binding protein n=1 Tax=Gilvimarinus sp. DZF01 TaxID=3461371 RepID=UPI004046293A
MIFDLAQIALICIAYMLVLFGIAFVTEKGWIPDSVVRHPITYILSLGVFASAFSFYGIVDLAFQYGYGALAYYLGTGAFFLFAPVALKPLTEIVRRYQIGSLADLLVFRYHSHAVGSLVTLCMIFAVVPLMALQLQAVADTLSLITANSESQWDLGDARFSSREALALTYCLILAVFTILFGSKREQRWGLITALALESLIKVCAFTAIGLFALFGVFGGFEGLDRWLADNPENTHLLHSPVREGASSTLLLVFLASAVAMPHIFHMSVVENRDRNSLAMVSWAFPLFLLFMALPIFPVLWAGFELNVTFPSQYFTLGVPMEGGSRALSIVAFLGGLSAATGAQVAISLALATMVLNHWLLPLFRLDTRRDFYLRLLWLRRLVILAIFVGGFLFFFLVHNRYSLTSLALLAFVAGLQFLPGIVAVAYWPRGNSRGFVAGLLAGMSVWALGLLVPTISGIGEFALPGTVQSIPVGFDEWNLVTLWSLGLNVAFFAVASWLSKTSFEERYSAELCAADEISHPVRATLDAHSAADFKDRLSEGLGREIAHQEVNRALRELGLSRNERRPYALRRLRNRLEANLSGLMGVSVAGEVLGKYLPYTLPSDSGTADIQLIEEGFARDEASFTGLTAQLNNLRLYYRKILQELPMAICSLGPDREILMWNNAMAELTNVNSQEVSGSHLDNLTEPWRTLISDFSTQQAPHSHRHAMMIGDEAHWFSLHKATIQGPVANSADGQVILVEDVTELQQLEKELLHSERLASIGRLAAGVAHEIGNPITGIACLAQDIRYEAEDPELLEAAEQILCQTDRVARIVQSLVSFSHAGSRNITELAPVALRQSVEQATELLSLQRDKTPVNFVNAVPNELFIQGDGQQLVQVFLNLLSNARDASFPGGQVRIDGEQRDDAILVSVTDEGEGIDPKEADRILEPFFTTKQPGEGTGLGLSMVYSIVTEHHGNIEVTSPLENGRGSRFTLRFRRSPGLSER